MKGDRAGRYEHDRQGRWVKHTTDCRDKFPAPRLAGTDVPYFSTIAGTRGSKAIHSAWASPVLRDRESPRKTDFVPSIKGESHNLMRPIKIPGKAASATSQRYPEASRRHRETQDRLNGPR